MNIDIKYNPSYAMALVKLADGEQVQAEGGAMMSMSPNVAIETHRATKKGGLLKSLKAAFLGGESFWMNTFTARGGPGEVALAPTLPGDVRLIQCAGTVFVQSSSYLGGSPSLEIDTKFQGLKGFFSGESLFFLKVTGNGPLLISSYGGIEELPVQGEILVDTGHIVGFQEGLSYEIRKLGGWKSFFLGGEGLVAHFKGSGKLWVQSRNIPAFTKWLAEKLPPKKQ
ncbi:MAG: TIGR00266 family protein [Spirochaetes bacterium]|nr:MAG: TIGR00266 family protein [Spirochaetota bacterium]